MKRWCICFTIFTILLCGCMTAINVTDDNIVANADGAYVDTIEVPITDSYAYIIKLPKAMQVIETDNNVYWKLSDDITIYLTQPVNHTASEYDEETGVYVSNTSVMLDFDTNTLIMQTKQSNVDSLVECLCNGSRVLKDTSLPRDCETKDFPAYDDMSNYMELTSGNLYMPKDYEKTSLYFYTSELMCSGSEWLETWILDGNLEDIKDHLVNIALCNSGHALVSSWYYDGDIFIVQAGDNIVCAKKLRYNEWYVYSGSANYKDYMYTGIQKVHTSEGV